MLIKHRTKIITLSQNNIMKKHLPTLLFITVICLAALLLVSIKTPTLLYNPAQPRTVNSVVEALSPQVMQRLTPNLISIAELPSKISLVALKKERLLQVYVHKDGKPKLLKTYPFTAYSGTLGPKLKQGDEQIPEGIYTIQHLNPNSSYHLSMKISYPNEFDRKMAIKDKRTTLGGDIFIHGEAVTIGCIPIGNVAIEELFVLAAKALPNGIDVIVSPLDFRTQDRLPDIPSVEWEAALYNNIRNALYEFPLNSSNTTSNKYPDILSYTVDPRAGNLRFYSKDDQGKPFLNHGNLNKWLNDRNQTLVFAANGGMFMKDYSPLGLYIENSKQIQKINRKQKGYGNFYLQPNGVFSLTKDHVPQIVKTDQFKTSNKLQYATQSGPMLVIDGVIHPKFNAPSKNVHIRNGVGILPDGQLLFAMSKKRINFYRLAEFFKTRGCQNALYLDGFVCKTYLPAQNWIEEEGKFGIVIAETKN